MVQNILSGEFSPQCIIRPSKNDSIIQHDRASTGAFLAAVVLILRAIYYITLRTSEIDHQA